MRYFLPFVLCFASTVLLQAQDLHYSQPQINPLHFNPAQTGVFRGDWRVSGLYRSQWESVPVPYRSLAAGLRYQGASPGEQSALCRTVAAARSGR
ncbi:MAG: type IX secretion system membrane protein PorP/SprF [Lewinellaceae bacterium]|nr:type IX secretion system membrane protein PorP/SprF [Lewinellaceae bacterium]